MYRRMLNKYETLFILGIKNMYLICNLLWGWIVIFLRSINILKLLRLIRMFIRMWLLYNLKFC